MSKKYSFISLSLYQQTSVCDRFCSIELGDPLVGPAFQQQRLPPLYVKSVCNNYSNIVYFLDVGIVGRACVYLWREPCSELHPLRSGTWYRRYRRSGTLDWSILVFSSKLQKRAGIFVSDAEVPQCDAAQYSRYVATGVLLMCMIALQSYMYLSMKKFWIINDVSWFGIIDQSEIAVTVVPR